MAQSMNPAGYIEPGVIENHVQVAKERGIELGSYADSVEGESSHLAAALRRVASSYAGETVRSEAPKGRRASAATVEG